MKSKYNAQQGRKALLDACIGTQSGSSQVVVHGTVINELLLLLEDLDPATPAAEATADAGATRLLNHRRDRIQALETENQQLRQALVAKAMAPAAAGATGEAQEAVKASWCARCSASLSSFREDNSNYCSFCQLLPTPLAPAAAGVAGVSLEWPKLERLFDDVRSVLTYDGNGGADLDLVQKFDAAVEALNRAALPPAPATGAAAAAQEAAWVPVGERLPDSVFYGDSNMVLAVLWNGNQTVAFYSHRRALWHEYYPGEALRVTHWMPLPTGPAVPPLLPAPPATPAAPEA